MATNPAVPTTPPVETPVAPAADLATLIKGLTEAMQGIGPSMAESLQASQRNAQKYGQWLARQPKRPFLTRKVFQNGTIVGGISQSAPDNQGCATNEEVLLLNQIVRPGRYIDRKVEVIVRQDGPDDVLEIRHAVKQDKMSDLLSALTVGGKFQTLFAKILAQIVEEQQEFLLDEETRPVAAKRR